MTLSGILVVSLVVASLTLLARYVWFLAGGPKEGSFQIPRKGDPAAPIVLMDFPRIPNLASSCSPYVSKVETWLRMHDLPYTKRVGDLASAPFQKLPYIEHGENRVPDSAFIIKYLSNTYPDKVRELNAEQQAISTAVTAVLESRLDMALLYFRWIHPKGFKNFVPIVFSRLNLNPLLTALAPYVFRARSYKKLSMVGYALFADNDKRAMLEDEAAALSTLLGEKKYLTGDVPCAGDASAFGFLDNCLNDGATPVIGETFSKHPNLVRFTDRIRKELYPDTCGDDGGASKSD